MPAPIPMSPLESVGGDGAFNSPKVFKFSWAPAIRVLLVAGAAYLGVSALNRAFNYGALALFAAFAVPVAGYFAYLAMRVRLTIDNSGVEFRESGQTTRLRWDEIDAVSCGAVAGRPGVRAYKLLSLGQTRMKFENEIQDSDRAYRTIERRLSLQVGPRLQEALGSAVGANFGVVTLTRFNIGIRHLTLPIKDAVLRRRGLEVSLLRRGESEPLVSVDAGDVHNLNVLLRMLRDLDPKAIQSSDA